MLLMAFCSIFRMTADCGEWGLDCGEWGLDCGEWGLPSHYKTLGVKWKSGLWVILGPRPSRSFFASFAVAPQRCHEKTPVRT